MARSLTRAMLLTLALSLLLAAPVSAMSPKKANKAALAVLKPQKTKGPVVVFALSKPIKAGARISEPNPAKASNAGVAKLDKGKALRKKGRLFWMDLHYGQQFAHDSVVLVLDDKTGKTLLKQKLHFWPRVNGKDAFDWDTTVLKRKGVIFKRLEPKELFTGNATIPVAKSAQTTPNPRYKNDCLYALGGQSIPTSFRNMVNYWKKLGVRQFEPPKPPKGKSHYDELEIQQGVAQMPDDCTDVILYLSGHGSGDSVMMEENGTNGRDGDLWLNAATVAVIIKDNPRKTFKLIVDACASGTFVDEVRRLDQRENVTNLLIDVSATTGSQSALAYPTLDGWKQPLTETLIQGMEASEDPVDKDQSGAPAGARLIELGMANRPKSTAETTFGVVPTVHSKLDPYSVTPPPTETLVCHSAGETCPKDNSTCDGGSTCTGNASTCSGAGTTCGPGSGDKCSGGAKCTGPGASCDGAGTECTQGDGSCTNGATCPAPPMTCTGTKSAFAPNTGWSFDIKCDKPWAFIKISGVAGNNATNRCCQQAGWDTGTLSGESVIWKHSSTAPPNVNQPFGIDWTMDVTTFTIIASQNADGSNPVTVSVP